MKILPCLNIIYIGLSLCIIEKGKYSSGGLINDCKLNLSPHITMDIGELGLSEDEAKLGAIESISKSTRKGFDQLYREHNKAWEKKWEALFTPNNSFVSGNFPILETGEPKVRRVYYMSAATLLYLTHTNFPVMKRVVLTGGPRWGASIMFYWDTTSWRTRSATGNGTTSGASPTRIPVPAM